MTDRTDDGHDHDRHQCDDRDIEPKRARELATIEAYARAPADDREARADVLGLVHARDCDGASDGLECWRCYYIRDVDSESEL